jgi:Tfp pilus assembly protein PilZ
MGGLFVRSATAFVPGTSVLLQIVRPGLKRAIQLAGQVVSVVSPAEARERGSVAGMGIVLQGLDRETEPRLRALVDDLAGIAPAPRQAAPAREESAAQARRIEQLEAEVNHLRAELLRRDRTIGALANRLAVFEKV